MDLFSGIAIVAASIWGVKNCAKNLRLETLTLTDLARQTSLTLTLWVHEDNVALSRWRVSAAPPKLIIEEVHR